METQAQSRDNGSSRFQSDPARFVNLYSGAQHVRRSQRHRSHRLWSTSDSGQPDYGSNGAGRIDVYHWAGDRTPGQVESSFGNAIRSNHEYGTIYVVYRGSGWKKG